jgi:hypothetical protein
MRIGKTNDFGLIVNKLWKVLEERADFISPQPTRSKDLFEAV